MGQKNLDLYIHAIIRTKDNRKAEIVHLFKGHDTVRVRYSNGIFDSIGKKDIESVATDDESEYRHFAST